MIRHAALVLVTATFLTACGGELEEVAESEDPVRVNNLANLEALINIIANGMEIIGVAWGGPTARLGYARMLDHRVVGLVPFDAPFTAAEVEHCRNSTGGIVRGLVLDKSGILAGALKCFATLEDVERAGAGGLATVDCVPCGVRTATKPD